MQWSQKLYARSFAGADPPDYGLDRADVVDAQAEKVAHLKPERFASQTATICGYIFDDDVACDPGAIPDFTGCLYFGSILTPEFHRARFPRSNELLRLPPCLGELGEMR